MEGSGLTPFAWIFMIASMGAVTGLAIFCFYRIMTTPSGPGAGGDVGATGEGSIDAGDRPIKR